MPPKKTTPANPHHEMMNVSIDDAKFATTIKEKCLSQNKDLRPNTVKNYPSQLKGLLRSLGVKTIAAALTKTTTEYKEALKDVTISTRSAYVNALVATLKACNVTTDIKFDEIKTYNTEMGVAKMDKMKENEGEIPVEFDKKVNEYLEKNKGTLNAVIIALMALSPTVRGHMLEGVVIARGREEYERIKKENEVPVIGIIGDTYKFNYVAGNKESKASAKVKDIQAEKIYDSPVVEQLKAYIKPDQVYMFPPKKGKSKYVATKTFNEWVQAAFDDAGIAGMGVQKLRRIFETRI